MTIQAPKGTKDILPQETPAWRFVERKFADVCRRFGFDEIRIPTFEQTELFQRSVGDTTDIVQKEMYTFDDKGGRSMTLRPEGTAGVARAYLENGLHNLPSPAKLFYDITCFRYEKMGKGRYREFHQFGCEVFGSKGPMSDAELIALLYLFFREIGLREISLKLNSIGCPKCRPAYLEKLREFLKPNLDHMCDTCQDRYERNPMRSLDCKEDSCKAIVKDAPVQLDMLCDECAAHFEELKAILDELGLPYEIDTHIVRGLDYYTKTVFEFVSEHVGTQGTITGGGRYDGLIAEMGGQDTPAVGFALGVERLLMELESQGVELPGEEPPALYIVSFPDTSRQAAKLCSQVRAAGLACAMDVMDRSFRAQMKYADRINARYLAVLGTDEIKSREFNLRDMKDGTEEPFNLDKLDEICEHLAK